MIIHLDTSISRQEAIDQAREVLLSGGIVACPTESFYGLAVDACNEEAIRRLFSMKKRASGRPVLILIPGTESLGEYVTQIPSVAMRLMHRFWPGGLTLVFKASPAISPLLTGGTGAIGIRLSSHPLVTALARSINRPVTGTSANISGAPPCSDAEAVFRYFGDAVDLILDDGNTEGKAGSTVLDITVDPPHLVREGMVPGRELTRFIQGRNDDSCSTL